MNKVKLEKNQSETVSSEKRVNTKEKSEIKEKPPIKEEKLSLKMKIILFASIGFSVCLIVAIVMIVLMTKKSKNMNLKFQTLKQKKRF